MRFTVCDEFEAHSVPAHSMDDFRNMMTDSGMSQVRKDELGEVWVGKERADGKVDIITVCSPTSVQLFRGCGDV